MADDFQSEATTFTRMISSLDQAEGCARALAHLRSDVRWLKISNLIHEMRQKTVEVAKKPGKTFIITQ